ncbi:MAG: hypothetical protein WAW85_16785 [Gordonia sp. (in: high G+C Gram-positive bacteria)]
MHRSTILTTLGLAAGLVLTYALLVGVFTAAHELGLYAGATA